MFCSLRASKISEIFEFILGAVQITDGFLFLKIESKKPKAKATNMKK
tara:strand:- start:421 stop:561 length:141 start_codon:yes stop_codon:yes gene_type:complete